MTIDFEKLAYAVGAAGAGLSAGFLWFQRKVSSNNLGIAGDRATAELIANLVKERDRYATDARDAWAARLSDAQAISTLDAENKLLKHDIAGHEQTIEALKWQMEQMRQALAKLDPTAAKWLSSQFQPTKKKDPPP